MKEMRFHHVSGAVPSAPSAATLELLASASRGRAKASLSAHLEALRRLVGDDLAYVDREIAGATRHETTGTGLAAAHLLSYSGKRARATCVTLAAQLLGARPTPAVRDLAVAVELVHNATLLHDDVVDESPERRGAPAARVVYGNAASIFAGDLVLVEALDRVARVGVPGLLERLLRVLRAMVHAEALQLESRGRFARSRAEYFEIAEGKTAALFAFGVAEGARLGGADEGCCRRLAMMGENVGVAFQIVDDVLDVEGDPRKTGKALFTDLREGKVGHPLVLALEKDASLASSLAVLAAEESEESPAALARVMAALKATGAIQASHAEAERRVALARAELASLPATDARDALGAVLETLAARGG